MKVDAIRRLMDTSTSRGKDGSSFDFNAVLPMPPILKRTRSPAHITLEVLEDDCDGESVLDNRYRAATPEEVDQILACGHADWYEWSIANWGTKWNAYDVQPWSDDNRSITFDTAWSPPTPVLAAISRLHPEVEMHLEVFDEMHNYWGEIEICAGRVAENLSTDPKIDLDRYVRLCVELKGYHPHA